MTKSIAAIPMSDEAIRELLERYRCPVPFHEVRTRFLGGVVTPVVHASPLMVIRGLWGGDLPDHLLADEKNELLDALVMGLWRRLALDEEKASLFHLVSVDVPATSEGLAALARTRREELDGFVDGLFAGEVLIELPKQADLSLDVLAEVCAVFAGVAEFASTHSGRDAELLASFDHLRALTEKAEREIHAVMISCAAARRQASEAAPSTRPTLH